MKPPCHNCSERSTQCHRDCKNYSDYKENLKKLKEQRDIQQNHDKDIDAVIWRRYR